MTRKEILERRKEGIKRMQELREQAIANGMKLLTLEEIREEVARKRGGMNYPSDEESNMTPERLAEIEARAEAATPGPWVDCHDQLNAPNATVIDHEWAPPVPGHEDDGYPITVSREDADFIAHARQDIPDLIAEVKRLNGVLQEASGLMTEAITEIERLREENEKLDENLKARACLYVGDTGPLPPSMEENQG